MAQKYHVEMRVVAPQDVKALNLSAVDEVTSKQAGSIMSDVRTGGEPKLLEIALKFGDIQPGSCAPASTAAASASAT